MASFFSVCVQRKSSFGDFGLAVAQPVAAGQPVLVEAPLVSIPLGRYDYGSYCWDLVDRILGDPQLLRQFRKLHLASTVYLRDAHDEWVESALVAKHHKSRQLVRELFFCVGTNNVGILNAEGLVEGYGLYPVLSRADHSCEPTTRLGPGPTSGTLSLVAVHAMQPGEPVTWSYFREAEFLGADFETRNLGLVNVFRFACRCGRCQRERPTHLKPGVDLLAYFDALIAQQAKALALQPDGVAQAMAESPMTMHQRALHGHS